MSFRSRVESALPSSRPHSPHSHTSASSDISSTCQGGRFLLTKGAISAHKGGRFLLTKGGDFYSRFLQRGIDFSSVEHML
eukprot:3526850-Pyramimonas_sp.AAC.1